MIGLTKLGGEKSCCFLRKAEKAKIEHQCGLEKLKVIKFKSLIQVFYSTTKQGPTNANYCRLHNVLLVAIVFKRARHFKQKKKKNIFSFSSLETDANHQISLNHQHVTQSSVFEKPSCFGTTTTTTTTNQQKRK